MSFCRYAICVGRYRGCVFQDTGDLCSTSARSLLVAQNGHKIIRNATEVPCQATDEYSCQVPRYSGILILEEVGHKCDRNI